MLQLHHLNGLFDAGIAVDLDIGALAVGESLFAQDLQRLGGMVKGGFHIGKAIKAGQCVAGILAQTIEDDTQGIFTDLIGAADNADAALRRREGFVTGQKAEARVSSSSSIAARLPWPVPTSRSPLRSPER